MTLTLVDYQAGMAYYWRDTWRRSPEVQRREREFPKLAQRYAERKPPHFTRAELEAIIEWKYTDRRWCNRALSGLNAVSDVHLQDTTARIANLEHPADAVWALHGFIKGVGPAGNSAILAAAFPERFPVIDVFAILAICHYESPAWIQALPRNIDGRFQPDEGSYAPYTLFCRSAASSLTFEAGELWTPRNVDMALWGIGKQLEDSHLTKPDCHKR